MTPALAALESPVEGLYASRPEPLPFAPSLHVRSFLLSRAEGNILVYAPARADDPGAFDEVGGVSRRYLGHGHEAMFLPDGIEAPLFVHEADGAAVADQAHVRGTFSRRHLLDSDFEVIPIPGHTEGATAYLWNGGGRRFLFTGDTIFLRGTEWVTALLESSDREAYLDSLALIAELDFDVLVPWAASAGGPYLTNTDRHDTRWRIDTIRRELLSG